MLYFSYNDFADYTNNGKIYGINKVEEKISQYEIKNGIKTEKGKNKIIEILRNKIDLKIFLKEFFNFDEIEDIQNINYCNNIKCISDKETNNNIICKLEDKEIFICIKIIKNIDYNISYKMLEHSLNIIKKWNIEEKEKNKRYPIVIPIVIYTGKSKWNNKNINNKLNYIIFKDNAINFSYNILNINDLEINELKNMRSKVAKRIMELKHKY